MSNPLRIPEGYGLEMQRGELDYLVLKRPDGSLAAAFEFSAIGSAPSKIMQIAWDDAEWLEQTETEPEEGACIQTSVYLFKSRNPLQSPNPVSSTARSK